MFVLDTNVASEIMRPAPASTVATWIAERDAAEPFPTAISEAELLYTEAKAGYEYGFPLSRE